jgi:hypothetical protein
MCDNFLEDISGFCNLARFRACFKTPSCADITSGKNHIDPKRMFTADRRKRSVTVAKLLEEEVEAAPQNRCYAGELYYKKMIQTIQKTHNNSPDKARKTRDAAADCNLEH